MKATDYRLRPCDIDAMTFAQIELYLDDEQPQSLSYDEVNRLVDEYRRAKRIGKYAEGE